MADGRSGRIRTLYVDSAENAPTVRDCLEAAERRLEVVTAADRETALETVRAEHVDCVVSEHDLPDGTGLDLLEAVRDHTPTLPFFLYPSDGSEQLASEAVAAGVTGYHPRTPLAETCEHPYSDKPMSNPRGQ